MYTSFSSFNHCSFDKLKIFFLASERYYSQLPGSVEPPIFPYHALFIVYSSIKTEAGR